MSGSHVDAYAFWFAACLLLYTYAGYPLWMYFRSRLQPRPQRQASILPTVSIILAVHNGAALLRQKVAHLLSLDYPQDRMEIEIVRLNGVDFVALEAAVRRAGFAVAHVEVGGIPHYHLEADLPHFCCRVCSLAAERESVLARTLRGSGRFRWVESLSVQKPRKRPASPWSCSTRRSGASRPRCW